METPAPIPTFDQIDTLFIDRADSQRLASLPNLAVWPPVGTVIEFADDDGNWDGLVTQVRLQLPHFAATQMNALVVVQVAVEPRGTTIPRDPGDRILRDETGDS